MNIDTKTPISPEHSSVRYMNAYERAHARQRMEQAMALADWTLRAWNGIRAALSRVGNVLRRTFAQDRPSAKDAVVRRG